ncbi:streptomycin 3''-adenylyltransferase [Geomicrobium sp. JCM 19038]|nr:streptomycin 3''-adenylyltransferase [Geomicrobium sp. JCM 19038]
MLIMDDQIDDYLRHLKEVVSTVLKDRLTGLYLSGSKVLGDYDEEVSDLDIFCVVNRPIRAEDQQRLLELLSEEELEVPGNGLEFLCVLEEEVTHPHSLPSYEFVLIKRRGLDAVMKHEGMDEGLLMDFTICYQSGKLIAGKPAQEVIGEVPVPWLNEAMKGSLRQHKLNVFHPFYDPYGHEAVLNACRSWCFKELGRMTSKTKGAIWALKRWKNSKVIEQALLIREGKWDKRLDEGAVHELLDHVLTLERIKVST